MLYLKLFHLLGVTMWIGGALAAFVLARAISDHSPEFRVSVWPLLARIHGVVIAPGAVITVISGAMLTIRLTNLVSGAFGTGTVVMQVTGILAAVLSVFVGLPTANQLALFARLDGVNELPPEAVRLRKRQALASSVAGVLALVALYFGVVVP